MPSSNLCGKTISSLCIGSTLLGSHQSLIVEVVTESKGTGRKTGKLGGKSTSLWFKKSNTNQLLFIKMQIAYQDYQWLLFFHQKLTGCMNYLTNQISGSRNSERFKNHWNFCHKMCQERMDLYTNKSQKFWFRMLHHLYALV